MPAVYTIVLTHGSAMVAEGDAHRAAAAYAAGGDRVAVQALPFGIGEARRVEIDLNHYRGIIEHENPD